MKRLLSCALILVMVFGGSLFSIGTAYAESQPKVIEQGEDYTLWDYGNGTKKLEVMAEITGDSMQGEAWTSQGETFTYASDDSSVALQRVYEQDQTLFTLERDGMLISLAPLMQEPEEIEPQAVPHSLDIAADEGLASNQTASNILRIPIVQPTQPERIEGELMNGAGGMARTLSAASSATPVVYEGLFDEQTDLQLTALRGGVKEDIVIHEYTGDHAFQYRLDATGVRAQREGNNIIQMVDAQGEVQFTISAPYMMDAAGAYSEEISMRLEGANGAYTMSIVPDDAWLSAPERVYPVTVDPIYVNHYHEFLSSASVTPKIPQWYHTRGQTIDLGGDLDWYAMYRISMPPHIDNVLRASFITEATIGLHVHTTSFNGAQYTFHQITSDWWDGGVAYENMPTYMATPFLTRHMNYYAQGIDVTSLYSSFYNRMNPKPNYGFLIKAVNPTADTHRVMESTRVDLANYPGYSTVRLTLYYQDASTGATKDPDLKAKAYGNGVNSESGYVDLTWSKVPHAEKYYVGIFNGKDFDYIDVGNTTSYSTKGKKLWPSPAQIASGKYQVRKNGDGVELPMMPTPAYKKSGNAAYANDTNYYFKIVPANKYDQTMDPLIYISKAVRLPDTVPPGKAATVTVSPASWTTSETMTVSWNGLQDIDMNGAQNGVPGGCIQYAIDQSATWTNTDQTGASGTVAFSTDGLADGQHVIYIRGRDAAKNTGAALGCAFYVDKTPPTKPELTLIPADWTKATDATIYWSGVNDAVGIARMEYQIDDGAWISTNIDQGTYDTGYVIDTTAIADGARTLRLRGVDIAGNAGEAAAVTLYLDRAAPVAGAFVADPPLWSNQDEVRLSWEAVNDPHSGIRQILYRILGEDEAEPDPGGAEIPTGWRLVPQEGLPDGDDLWNLSSLPDGIHTASLRLTDVLGNQRQIDIPVYRDTTPPELSIDAPQDGDVVNGSIEIWGSIADRAIAGWSLTAEGSGGLQVLCNEGAAEQNTEMLGRLNIADFEHGETVTLTLKAWDIAGNESLLDMRLEVNKSTIPLASDVKIIRPESGEALAAPTFDGQYTKNYTAGESRTWFYQDGIYMGDADSAKRSFSFDPIDQQEGSLHSLALLSLDRQGEMHFSQGLGYQLRISDTFVDDTLLSAYAQVDFTDDGAELTGSTGYVEASSRATQQPILALRLRAQSSTPGASRIAYEYALDGQAVWQPIQPGAYIPLEEAHYGVRLRATLIADGAQRPTLHSWDFECVVELSPVRYIARLMAPVEAMQIGTDRLRYAKSDLELQAPETLREVHAYADGVIISDSATLDALRFPEQAMPQIAAVAVGISGTLYVSGTAKNTLLLRETPHTTDREVRRAMTSAQPLHALRLLSVVRGGRGTFEYSLDETQWHPVTEGRHILLARDTMTVYLRCRLESGAELSAWHLEGITAAAKPMLVQLVEAPDRVAAAQYGEAFDEEQRRHVISWQNRNKQDDTAVYGERFTVYRDSEVLEETLKTSHTDARYAEDLHYMVQYIREYIGPEDGVDRYLQRKSALRDAEIVAMTPPEAVAGAVYYDVLEEQQSAYLNELYGGNYSFSTEAKPPDLEERKRQILLGDPWYCAHGYEPINFNSGNFYLMAQDISYSDLGGADLSMTRTYNAQSNEADGPFGERWASSFSEHLVLYGDGSLGYRRDDGSLVIFEKQADGSYAGNDADFLTVAIDEEAGEYHIAQPSGETHVFTVYGLLKRIVQPTGQAVEVQRDEWGLITALTGPSGAVVGVEMDEAGHIVALASPGGERTAFAYEGTRLVSVTSADGGTVRYVYDDLGRMTEWYDALGNRQVYNVYDELDRVVEQTDALDGVFTLRYAADATFATDAQGNLTQVYYDEQGRTLRTIDAEGAETAYAYSPDGTLASATDALGQLTTYQYDARGNRTQIVLPSGATTQMAYDEANNLIQRVDANGHETRYEYDEQRRMTRETAADGGVTQYAYNEAGQLVFVTDALGAETRYDYQGVNLWRATDANGASTYYAYDAEGRVTHETNALGEVTRYEYDSVGNLAKLIFADGTAVAYTYDKMGNVLSVTDPLGNKTAYAYDALMNVTKVTYADGSVEQMAYTPGYQLESLTDAIGGQTTYAYDGQGNLIRETDALGQETRMAYDAQGRLVKKTLPNGAEMDFAYDEATGLLASSTDETGLTNTFTYDAAGNLLERGLPGGAKLVNEFDGMGRMTRQTGLRGEMTEIEYDLRGNVVRIIDALGGETSYEYDALGNMTKATDALGAATTYQYDRLGRLARVTDALGGETRYAYDSTGSLIRVTDALGGETAYEYDAAGNLTAMTDALGGRIAMTYDKLGNTTQTRMKNGGVLSAKYDKAGRLVQETDAAGAKTQYAYDALGRVTAVTDALGSQAQFTYDEIGNITGITAPDGSQTLYAYDKGGRLASTTDAAGLVSDYTYNEQGQVERQQVNGAETAYEHDAAGNITRVTDAEGREVRLEYDALGNATKILYADGSADEMAYDALGRLVSETPRDGVQRTYTYDALGNITRATDGLRETLYTYDALGRLTQAELPDGAVQSYAYDALGNLLTETDALGQVTAYTYDAESWLERIEYANGAAQRLEYDKAGRVTRETDPLGAQTRYTYDKAGRLTAVRDALGGTTRYTYDSMDNLIKVQDALHQATGYEYDSLGRLTSETDALGNTARYSYTPEGWLQSATQPDGTKIQYSYDLTGQLLSQAAEGLSITRGYNEIGELTTASGADGETAYQYDDRGNLVSVSYPNGDTVGYTYDEYGRKTGVTGPEGGEARYTYDSMDRLIRVEGADGESVEYSYDLLGRRIETAQDNLTTTYAYDAMGNITGQQTRGESALSLAYAYDLNGQMIQEKRAENGGAVTSDYAYDKLGRLVDYSRSDGTTESYRYDAVGNMTQKTADGQKASMRYNKANQLTEMRGNGGKISYEYDANGNLTRKQMGDLTDTYTYDALDRLVGYSGHDGFEQQYTLNAQGLRASMEQQGSANRRTLEEMLLGIELPESEEPEADGWTKTEYIWDVTLPYGQLLTETTKGSTTRYLYGLERISATNESRKTQYVYDMRGSVAQTLTAQDGVTSAKSLSYTPFGSPLDEQSRVTGFGYNAEYYDAATGMLNLRARQYEPAMNRFSQKDILKGSAWLPQSLNRYAFVMNDPVGLADPSGMIWEFALAGVVAKAALTAAAKAITAAFAGTVAFMLGAATSTPTIAASPRDYRDKDYVEPGLRTAPPLCVPTDVAVDGDIALPEPGAEPQSTPGPSESTDSAKGKDDRLHGEPGSTNVEGSNETKIGEGGKATKERHHTDHGNSSKHTNPHDHDITWDEKGNPQFGPAQNYPDGNIPTF